MKKRKKIIAACVCILITCFLAGCNTDNNVRNYLQALLDVSYKNDSTTFLEMKLGLEQEAQALYEQGVNVGIEAFCTRISVPEELREDFRQIYMDMLSKVNYTVGDAQKQSDGSYIVTVEYQKMIIFQPTLDAHAQKTQQLYQTWTDNPDTAPTDENEMMRQIIVALKDSMEDVLTNVAYGEAETTTVRIELVNKVYTPNTNDVQKLEMLLFDTDTGNHGD